MIEVYAELLASHAVDFGTLLGSLVEPDGLPALFHCTAGKDRTGAGVGDAAVRPRRPPSP
jgi:protein-tyrosine phosphatase